MKGKINCITSGCFNNNRDPNYTFFSLPKEAERRRQWLTLVDREDLLQKGDLKRKSYLICSGHFEESSIKIIKHLRESALPTMRLPNRTQKGSSSSEAQSRVKIMKKLAMCRICLNDNVQHLVKSRQLQEIYEGLTTVPFQTDMRPLGLCYICYGQLRASHRFKLKCLQGEQLLAQMLDRLLAEDQALDPIQVDRSGLHQLSISPVEQNIINSTVQGVRINETESLFSECDVKLEEEITTEVTDTGKYSDSEPDNKRSLSDLEDDMKLNNMKLIREKEEVRAGVAQQLMIGVPVADGRKLSPVANSIQDFTTSSEHNDIEDDKIKIISDVDLIVPDVCRQNIVREHCSNEIKYNNDSGVRISVVGDKLCLSGETKYTCDNCKQCFSEKRELITHISNVGTCFKPYICKVCDKAFYRKNCLKSHALTHSGLKWYACDVCKKTFTQKNRLLVHSFRHTGVKPYACEVCKKRFSHKSYLLNHTLLHTGEKPYVCNVCQKGFTQKSNLKIHSLTHSGDRPFVCDVCQKDFVLRSHLKRHKLIHLGVRPYVCNICKKGFTRMSALKNHEVTHK